MSSAVSELRRPFMLALGVFVVSRLCVLAGAAVRATQVTVDIRACQNDRAERLEAGRRAPSCEELRSPARLMADVFNQWDGQWYLRVARDGYPKHVPETITYNQPQARTAFFPGYPGVVRGVDTVLPGGDVFAALAVNLVLSVVAIGLLGLLAYQLFDRGVATKAMILFAIFPGSFVLSYAYAEALFIVLAIGTLLLLHNERWLAAGIVAALATATRPNGIALVAACAVAAFIAIRHKRDWSSLIAPALAPIGVIAFHLYLWARTDERGVWFRVQREAWDEGTSFGRTAVSSTLDFVLHPFNSPTDAITAVSFAALIFGLWCLWKRPLPWPMMAFVIVIVLLMLLPDTVTARPRFVFTAFPMFISAAAWWPKRDRYAWDLTLLACGAGLTTLVALYAVFGVIP